MVFSPMCWLKFLFGYQIFLKPEKHWMHTVPIEKQVERVISSRKRVKERRKCYHLILLRAWNESNWTSSFWWKMFHLVASFSSGELAPMLHKRGSSAGRHCCTFALKGERTFFWWCSFSHFGLRRLTLWKRSKVGHLHRLWTTIVQKT